MADLLTRRALAHLDEPMRQIVYALERARDANAAEASRRLNALDYNAEFFAEDAESLQKAIDWICAARSERGLWRQRLATLSHDAGNRLIDEAIDAAEPLTAERDGHVATSDWPMPNPRTPNTLQNNELPPKEGGHPRTPDPMQRPGDDMSTTDPNVSVFPMSPVERYLAAKLANEAALRCASSIERTATHGTLMNSNHEAADHIRRLVAENEDLRAALGTVEAGQ